MTEEVYKRFSWVFSCDERICIHNHTDNQTVHHRNVQSVEKKDNIYHIGSPICASMYYFVNYQIKRAYQKNPFISEHGHSDI